MKCHVCENEVLETDKYCSECGVVLIQEKVESELITCDKCGKKLKKTDRLCLRCGNVIEEEVLQHKVCHICNQAIGVEDKFCMNCGAMVVDAPKESVFEIRDYRTDNKTTKSKIFTANLIAMIIIVFFGNLAPIFFAIVSLGILGAAIYLFTKERSRKNGWAIAFAALALLFSSFNYTNNLVSHKYALASGERISKQIGIKLHLPEPDFENILIMDGEVIGVTLTEYAFNDIIYELDETEASDIEAVINYNSDKFSNEHIELLYEKFDMVMMQNVDIALVYNNKTKKFELPEKFENYDIIIINYDSDEQVLQILEIKG